MDAQIVARQLAKLRPPMLNLQDIVVGAVLLAVIGVTAALVLIGHPRAWWTHSSFDVDEYIVSDLVPRISRNVDMLLALKHDSGSGLAACGLEVTDDGGLAFPVDTSQSVRPSTAAAFALLSGKCGALGSLEQTAYSRADFTAGLVDLGDAASVRNSRPHAYNLLITQAADACGTLAATVCDTYLGLLLLIGAEDMRNLQLDHINVGLAELARTYSTSLGTAARDPYIAHIGHCAMSGDLGLELHRVVAERIAGAVLALADLGYIYNIVVPQVRTMRYTRRAVGFANVFWVFFGPYSSQWFAQQAELTARYERKRRSVRQDQFMYIINGFISRIKAGISM